MGFFSRLFGKRDDDGPTTECVACESKELEPLAEGVYRCRSCGYEGGEGLAAYLAQKEQDALAQRPTPALRERVTALIRDIELQTDAALGGGGLLGQLGIGNVRISIRFGDGDLDAGGADRGLAGSWAADSALTAQQDANRIMEQVTRDVSELGRILVALDARGEGAPEVLAGLRALRDSNRCTAKELKAWAVESRAATASWPGA